MPATDTHRAIDAVWRIESPRLIAGLTRIVRDVGVAEDLAQDALVAALEQWPDSGVPDNPGAWLMAAAKHRAIDYFRRNTLLGRPCLILMRLSTTTWATTSFVWCSSPVIRRSRPRRALRLPSACLAA